MAHKICGRRALSARVLDGAVVSKEVRAEVARRAASLRQMGVIPRLDVIVAAQDEASLAYVRMKSRWGAEAGIESRQYPCDSSTTQAELLELIARVNADPLVHGVLIQHPLPSHLDERAALLALGPDKDVDGITPQSLGMLVADAPGFRPATPLGMMKLLERYGIEAEGKRAVVVGRSVILGKPAAFMLLQRNATVTIAHSRTRDLAELCRSADILVAAVGRAEMVKGSWIKPGAVVLDAGYNRIPGRDKDVGDVEFESAQGVAGWISPVPGGVGPMTVALLLSNVVDAAEARSRLPQ